MSPKEAVQTHKDLRSKLLLPVHWGTFNLAQHAWNDPPEEMIAAAEKQGLRAGVDYVVPMPGQFVDAASPPPVTAWWRY
jgi:L-ascorbate metabolism protein UlaG (beta-lactamase superfamily)